MLGKKVVQYVADSAVTCNLTPKAYGLTNFRKCSKVVAKHLSKKILRDFDIFAV